MGIFFFKSFDITFVNNHAKMLHTKFGNFYRLFVKILNLNPLIIFT